MIRKGLAAVVAANKRQSNQFVRSFLGSNSRIGPNISVRFSSSTPTQDNQKVPAQEPPTPSTQEVDIYRKPQDFTIRVMFAISSINFMYWSSILVNHYLYKGMVVAGIDLAGDPLWGYVGCLATTGFLLFTRHFAHHTVHRASLIDGGKQLRLQVHTMAGSPGKIYDVPIGTARFLSVKQQEEVLKELADDALAEKQANSSFASRILDSSFVPVKIPGVGSNLIVDKYGLKSYDQKLAHMLSAPKEAVATIHGKEERKQWREKVLKHSRSSNERK